MRERSTAAPARAETKKTHRRLLTCQAGEWMRLYRRARGRTTRERASGQRQRQRAPRPRRHIAGCKRARPASGCDCITAHVENDQSAREWSTAASSRAGTKKTHRRLLTCQAGNGCDSIAAQVKERPECARVVNGGANARRDQEDTSPAAKELGRREDATASPRTSKTTRVRASGQRAETKKTHCRLLTCQAGEWMRLHHRARRRTTRVRASGQRRRPCAPRP